MSEMVVAASGAISAPAGSRERLADRFLARVAALTPAEWGRLDAIAQRETAGDPIARWRRIRRVTGLGSEPEWLQAGLAALVFGLEMVQSVATLVRGDRLLPAPRAGADHLTAEARALDERVRALWDTAQAQPGGQREATRVLTMALVALWSRALLSPAAFARQYELVEPVIPIRSLER